MRMMLRISEEDPDRTLTCADSELRSDRIDDGLDSVHEHEDRSSYSPTKNGN